MIVFEIDGISSGWLSRFTRADVRHDQTEEGQGDRRGDLRYPFRPRGSTSMESSSPQSDATGHHGPQGNSRPGNLAMSSSLAIPQTSGALLESRGGCDRPGSIPSSFVLEGVQHRT